MKELFALWMDQTITEDELKFVLVDSGVPSARDSGVLKMLL